MQTRNDLAEYRPIFRTIAAFILYSCGRLMTQADAYSTADAFLDQLDEDLRRAEADAVLRRRP